MRVMATSHEAVAATATVAWCHSLAGTLREGVSGRRPREGAHGGRRGICVITMHAVLDRRVAHLSGDSTCAPVACASRLKSAILNFCEHGLMLPSRVAVAGEFSGSPCCAGGAQRCARAAGEQGRRLVGAEFPHKRVCTRQLAAQR